MIALGMSLIVLGIALDRQGIEPSWTVWVVGGGLLVIALGDPTIGRGPR